MEPDQLPASAPLWSSNSFRSLLLNAIDVVVIVGPDSAIQYASPGVEREFGYRTQELIGGSFVDLIHPDDQERLADLFAQLRAAPGSECATEVRSRHSDGTWRWLEVGCTNLTEDPAIRGIVVVAHNATTRVKAEEALRASEVRFRSAFDSAVDVVTITDAGGRIQYQTPSVERVFGYGTRDLFGTVLGDLVYPTQRADWDARLERIAAEPGASDTSEWDLRHFDGGWRTVEVVWNNLLRDPSVRGVVVIARDITEHKRTEERLRAQASLLDLAHDAIRVIDWKTDAIVYWNHGSEALYDYTREEAIGAVSQDLFRTEPPEPGREALKELLLIEKQWEGEIIHFKRDGTPIVVASRWALQSDAQGQPKGILQINRDITERKRAEEELRENASMLASQVREAQRARGESRAVLDAASEAMILLSPEQGRILSINQRFSELFELHPEQIVGKPVDELLPWIKRSFEAPDDVAMLIVGHITDSERQITGIVIQQSPEHRELQLISNPVLGHDGTFFGRLHAFRDITLEREIDRMKSEFISLVSHELRTPLTSIKGYVDVLLDGDLGPIPAEQEKFLRIASQNTDRLVVLINEVLD
nr:PAS domain S-box protein [Chloroflexia bacterium]